MSLTRLFASSRSPSQRAFDSGLPNPFYEFEAKDIKHQPFNFAQLKGKVVLIVNVASSCGFTPQYTGLQALYEKHKDKGLEILGFPCSQFGNQEFAEEDSKETQPVHSSPYTHTDSHTHTHTHTHRHTHRHVRAHGPTQADDPRLSGGVGRAGHTEIESFCSRNYNVTFRMFERIDVNGSKAHPVWSP
jgi:glutathione peroxidase-family protein